MVMAAPAGLPREVAYAVLAMPVASEPILNPDVFREPVGDILREIAGNYVPAIAMLVVLFSAHRLLARRLAAGSRARRMLATAGLAGVAAAVTSVVVLPVHRLVAGDAELALGAYLQRNVGFLAVVVALALVLDDHRLRARAAERRVIEEHKAALRAQMDALQSRTQPHFLFNVLNTIAALIRDDAALAEQTVHRLASLLRHALHSTRSASVTVARELEVVGEYLEIQRARYGARLRHSIAVDRDAEPLAIPPFIVQPLVENAVMHAIASRASGGTIGITARRRGDRLVLQVVDDGPGPGGSLHRGSQTSLDDLRARLELRHGAAATIAIGSQPSGGFRVELAMPAEVEPCA